MGYTVPSLMQPPFGLALGWKFYDFAPLRILVTVFLPLQETHQEMRYQNVTLLYFATPLVFKTPIGGVKHKRSSKIEPSYQYQTYQTQPSYQYSDFQNKSPICGIILLVLILALYCRHRHVIQHRPTHFM